MKRKAVLMTTMAIALLLVSAGVALAATIHCDGACFGTLDDDRMYGSANDNLMLADAGNDKVYGRDGEDYLEGDSGRDLLVGGSGADTLDAETSEMPSGPPDTIKAGANSDIILARNRKSDRIDCGRGPVDDDDIAIVDIDGSDRARNCELVVDH